MKVSFIVCVIILLFQQISGEVSQIYNERKRILLLGENNLEKQILSNIILGHQVNESNENFTDIFLEGSKFS